MWKLYLTTRLQVSAVRKECPHIVVILPSCAKGFCNGRRGKPSATLGEPLIQSFDRCDITTRNTTASSFERLLQGACRGNRARGVGRIRKENAEALERSNLISGADSTAHTYKHRPRSPALCSEPVQSKRPSSFTAICSDFAEAPRATRSAAPRPKTGA